jgi:hypothetical protein
LENILTSFGANSPEANIARVLETPKNFIVYHFTEKFLKRVQRGTSFKKFLSGVSPFPHSI